MKSSYGWQALLFASESEKKDERRQEYPQAQPDRPKSFPSGKKSAVRLFGGRRPLAGGFRIGDAEIPHPGGEGCEVHHFLRLWAVPATCLLTERASKSFPGARRSSDAGFLKFYLANCFRHAPGPGCVCLDYFLIM